MSSSLHVRLALACGIVTLAGCTEQVQQTGVKGKVERVAFNRTAAEQGLPLFWVEDKNGSGKPEAEELAVLWGQDGSPWNEWVGAEGLTARGSSAVERIAAATSATDDLAAAPDKRRRELVLAELRQSRPTLLYADLRGLSPGERSFVEHIVAASERIEGLYLRQMGSDKELEAIPADDGASRAMFYRNHGPRCVAPMTESEPECGALASMPKRTSGLYPAAIQDDADFCKKLEAHPDQAALLAPFVVVREKEGKLVPVPYNVEYQQEMTAVSQHLETAAAALAGANEPALVAYLKAAAQAFLDNRWEPADEAWAAMNVNNSKWYLRIGPDETYFEPCSNKAGFHVSFARINQSSLTWQQKLDPLKNDMEQALAALAGPPYTARQVSFHLPDFIDIVLNAGDSRSPSGATIGQSLPNWGPVANEGRGRTVAMTNLYTDPDSLAALDEQIASVVCPASIEVFGTKEGKPEVMSTVLHEACHNLGPSHEYRVGGPTGKVDGEVFGGPLASMLEELKAQSGALFLADWLVARGAIGKEEADRAHAGDVAWMFGHISRGMYTAEGTPRPYSQLSSIQAGFFRDAGALRWDPAGHAANGKDVGCFSLDLEKMRAAAPDLMKQVIGIKARGDATGAKALLGKYVDAEDEWSQLRSVIRERWLRSPKPSFVYAIRL